MTIEQKLQFDELVKPVMKWLCENANPHSKIIIEPTSAELVSGESVFVSDEFVLD